MQTSTKQTPKSCSCTQCRRGKRSRGGHLEMRNMTRAIRSAWRAQRFLEDPVVAAAPAGGYFD